MKKFEFLEHTADIKIKVFGENINEVFENSALAVSDYLARGNKIKSEKKKKINVKGRDLNNLLYGFLDEIVYFLDADNFIISKARVKVNSKKSKLTGEIYGDDASNYKNLDQVKAATYSEMCMKKISEKKWEAQFVLDI